MPILTGFANYFVPLMISATSPSRLNAFGYGSSPRRNLLHYSFHRLSPNAGWFNCAARERIFFAARRDYWLIALGARHRLGQLGDQSHRHHRICRARMSLSGPAVVWVVHHAISRPGIPA
jgi:hypothetical protein